MSLTRLAAFLFIVIFTSGAPRGQGPIAASFSPAVVSAELQTQVTVLGSGFSPGDEIGISTSGCNPLALFPPTVFVSPNELRGMVGFHQAGFYDVWVLRSGIAESQAPGQLVIRNPAPVLTGPPSLTFPRLLNHTGAPMSVTVQGALLGGYVASCGAGDPGTYLIETPVGGFGGILPQAGFASQQTLTFPDFLMAEPGFGYFSITNPSPGGGTTTLPFEITCPTNSPLHLSISQPQGSGSILIENFCGDPQARYFTAISLDPANLASPGTGPWAGLHISVFNLTQQFANQGPPFVGNLDGNGHSSFSIAPLPGVQGQTLGFVHAITVTFDASSLSLIEVSNLETSWIQ